MKLLKTILILAALYWAMEATAQNDTSRRRPINQLDTKGKRHGLWLNREEARMGEPFFTEFGSYNHGRKTGVWHKMDEDGDLIASETFRNNTLNGEAKYFEKGRLLSVGTFRGLNPDRELDTFMVENPVTGIETMRTISTERGHMRHGMWRHYDSETGRLKREEEYQVDELIYSKDFNMTHADSIYYFQRASKLPHNSKKPPAKSPKKRVSLIDY